MGKHSSDKECKKEKKAKKAKKKSQREKHDEKNTDDKKEKILPVVHVPDVTAQSEARPTCTPHVAITVPLATNLGGDVDGSDKAATASGWSWGQAFSAAAEIRPNDDDLDEDFLRRTATATATVADFNQQGGNGGLAAIASMIGNANTSSSHAKISEPAVPESTSLGINTEPSTPTVEEGVSEKGHKSQKDKKKKKKSKKKDKKKKRKEDPTDDTSSEDGSNSKHKSKKRRRSNDSSSSEEDYNPDPTSDSAGAALEGRMIPCDPTDPSSELMMVLVDATSGAVFSGMDRTGSGDRIRIGKLVNGQVVLDSKSTSEGDNIDEGPSSFPFPVDADDHCESPLDAYEDLAPILTKLCEGQHGFPKKKSPSDLAIYDPYYCDGSVIRNLSSLGFSNVYNKKEDCYKIWSSDKYPEYDVFITNPPYSTDHIERLMKHVTSSKLSSRPWFLLMPNWVHKKDYYTKALDNAGIKPFYLIPKKGRRYVYIPPKEFRSKKASDVHKKSSPFMSMWYCYGGTPQRNASLVDWCHRYSSATWDVARSKSALRDLRRKQQKQKGKGKAK